MSDGKILSSWTCDKRPELHEVRQVLGHALTKYGHPEVIWGDAYLADLVIPEVTRHGIRVHVRMIAKPAEPLPVAPAAVAAIMDAPHDPEQTPAAPGRMTAAMRAFWMSVRGTLWLQKSPN